MTDPRFIDALERIDAIHAEDPRNDQDGERRLPYELLYAERMSAWLARVAPEASIPLQLAVRAQHLRRWALPRDSYPMDRAGYHAWRSELKRRQAELAEQLIAAAGFEASTALWVAALIRKEKLKQDPETQALEDTTCLVFLAYYFDDFAAEHDDDKLVDILAKTWRKMSPHGQSLTAELPLSPRAKALIERALGV